MTESLRQARNVLAADQIGEFRKLYGPSQLVEDAAQSDQPVDTGGGREWRCLRTQARHPAEDVTFTAQLVEAVHLRMIGSEIAQEVADSSAVMTSRVGAEGNTEGINRSVEERSQSMLERRASRTVHEGCGGVHGR